MQIDLNIEKLKSEGFYVREGLFCGVEALLINPREQGIKWTAENKIFRSSIWSLTGEGLSFSFQKFCNLGERPDVFPPPKNLDNTNLIDKIDGSTAVIDWFNGKLNVRSRGTFNARTLDNGEEFYEILNKYPNIELLAKNNGHLSYIFEIVTPKQRIILDYPELDCYLIGAIDKRDYSLTSQHILDIDAIIHGLKRPKRYSFDSLDNLIKYIDSAQNIEGCCIYSNDDNDIHKVKSSIYLRLHRAKSQIGSISGLLDLWFQYNKPDHVAFFSNISKDLDFELAKIAKCDINKICDAAVKSDDIINKCKSFASSIKKLDRKSAAQQILQGPLREYSDILFSALDNKQIPDKMYRKLMERELC